MDEPLTAAERIDFERILVNAAAIGWLGPDQQLAVRPTHTHLVIRSIGGCARERTYARTRSWLFELLHDLANGEWQANEKSPSACADGDFERAASNDQYFTSP